MDGKNRFLWRLQYFIGKAARLSQQETSDLLDSITSRAADINIFIFIAARFSPQSSRDLVKATRLTCFFCFPFRLKLVFIVNRSNFDVFVTSQKWDENVTDENFSSVFLRSHPNVFFVKSMLKQKSKNFYRNQTTRQEGGGEKDVCWKGTGKSCSRAFKVRRRWWKSFGWTSPQWINSIVARDAPIHWARNLISSRFCRAWCHSSASDGDISHRENGTSSQSMWSNFVFISIIIKLIKTETIDNNKLNNAQHKIH